MHPTLLPRHRGRAPIPWAILTGLAKHRRDAVRDHRRDRRLGLDRRAGRGARSRPDETATTLFERIADGPRRAASASTCRSSSRGRAPRIPQDPSARERLAEADPGRRDHRLGDARAVPLRLGARADAALSRRVHVPRRREGRRLARAARRARPRRAGRDDRRRARRGAGRGLRRGRSRARGDRDRGCSARSGSEARMTRVLVFAAHPDDEVLGMGGTIAVHAAARGDAVRIVCVTDGSSTQYPGDARARAEGGRGAARRRRARGDRLRASRPAGHAPRHAPSRRGEPRRRGARRASSRPRSSTRRIRT